MVWNDIDISTFSNIMRFVNKVDKYDVDASDFFPTARDIIRQDDFKRGISIYCYNVDNEEEEIMTFTDDNGLRIQTQIFNNSFLSRDDKCAKTNNKNFKHYLSRTKNNNFPSWEGSNREIAEKYNEWIQSNDSTEHRNFLKNFIDKYIDLFILIKKKK